MPLSTAIVLGGPLGTVVTINGSNFGASQSNSIVTFNGSSASAIYFWSDTNIQAKVPNGATTGNVAVTV